MAQIYNRLTLDVKKSNHDIITAVQHDANSRFLDIVLIDNGVAINLTDNEVRIYAKKPDNKEIYNEGTITEATNGRVQIEMTSQLLAAEGYVEAQVVIFKDNQQILTTLPFKIHVVSSLMGANAIESSNEYGALVVLYQNLYEAYDLMTAMVQKIGTPGTIAQELNLDTMFGVWDWMADYLRRNSSAGIVDKIGTPTDASTTPTLFGRIAGIRVPKAIHVFNKPGTYSLQIPTGVTKIYVTMCGGGGGGGGGGYGENTGGAVGAGGTGGTGGITSISGVVSCAGGQGGSGGAHYRSVYGGEPGGSGGGKGASSPHLGSSGGASYYPSGIGISGAGGSFSRRGYSGGGGGSFGGGGGGGNPKTDSSREVSGGIGGFLLMANGGSGTNDGPGDGGYGGGGGGGAQFSSGGGGGDCVLSKEFSILSPRTLSITVGAGGTGGEPFNASFSAGGVGGSGLVIIEY